MNLQLWHLRYAFARWRFAEGTSLPEGPRVFLFLAADYGNLGDVAITTAQRRFLDLTFPERPVIAIPISKTVTWLDSVARQIGSNDIITTIGGGNTGYNYADIEALRRLVIKAFPDNPIIAFPQSIDLGVAPSESDVRKFMRPYRAHRRLTFCVREHRSYAKLLPLWEGQEGLLHVPDIVLSHPREPSSYERNGVILSLRNDSETSRGVAGDRQLKSMLAKHFSEVAFKDTEVGCRFGTWAEGEAAVERLLDAYRGAQLVVTDRLHGMILAERAGTPCIALDNSNHKISATYRDWLSDSPNIRFIQSISKQLDDAVSEVEEGGAHVRPLDERHPAFKPLHNALRKYS